MIVGVAPGPAVADRQCEGASGVAERMPDGEYGVQVGGIVAGGQRGRSVQDPQPQLVERDGRDPADPAGGNLVPAGHGEFWVQMQRMTDRHSPLGRHHDVVGAGQCASQGAFGVGAARGEGHRVQQLECRSVLPVAERMMIGPALVVTPSMAHGPDRTGMQSSSGTVTRYVPLADLSDEGRTAPEESDVPRFSGRRDNSKRGQRQAGVGDSVGGDRHPQVPVSVEQPREQ